MTQLADAVLSGKLSGKAADSVRALTGELEDEDMTVAAAMVARQAHEALKGNVRAFEKLTDMVEREEAREAYDASYRVCALDLTRDFVEPYRTIHACFDGDRPEVTDIVLRGGRGGTKSTFITRVAFEAIKQDPNANVVFGRRYQVDIKNTVFAQFKRVIAEEGDDASWRVTNSPARCTYLPSGASAYFFGFDNPEQLKSFVPEKGYVKLLVFEEADEMRGMEQMDSAADTFLRSNGFEGAQQVRVLVFNPPASRSNFMNEWCADRAGDPSTLIFDSSYLTVPPDWLGDAFMRRAEWARRNKPEWYRNNYLGEVTGTGGELFPNVEFRQITDEEARRLEDAGHARNGLDFGYEHPMAWERVAWERESDTVYAIAEVVEQRARLGDFLRKCDRWKAEEVICDSAEPDRMAEMREGGWDAVGAVKQWGHGRGRAYSWDWLRMRSRIVCDPERTPRLAQELRSLEFERLKGGGYSSKYPDLGEDCVMAVIYALNREIRAADTYDG